MARILLVDDNDALRDEIATVLTLEGYEVVTATSGREALGVMATHRPDLVVCDLVMPDMDGYETLRAVREQPDTETLQFLFLTGRDDRQHMRQGMELGADDYITKPFRIDELLRAVAVALEKRARIERQADVKLEQLRESIAVALPHELRTPLACIMGYAEMLADAEDGPSHDEVAALAKQILGAGERLNRMSENALLYVQLELLDQGRGTVDRHDEAARTRLDVVAAESARRKAAAHARDADLALELGEVTVAIPRAYVAKLVDELVDNACKFSPPGTPIRILAGGEAGVAVLRVSDGGPGMTPEQVASVGGFVQFQRSVREQQGLGLGLGIATRIATVWGGSLEIAGVPGSGTAVTVRLPGA